MSTTPHQPLRRSVLKGAAWAAPVIVAAAAAPAAAAFSATVTANQNAPQRSGLVNVNLTISGTINNSGTARTDGLKLVVDLTFSSANRANTAPTPTTAPTGWSVPVKTTQAQTASYTYTAVNQIPAGQSLSFSQTFENQIYAGSSKLTPSVNPNGTASASATATFGAAGL